MATVTQNSKSDLLRKFSKAASSNNGRIHVVPSHKGWSVKKEGSKRASAVRSDKNEAVEIARSLTKGNTIIIHKKDGTIQKII